MQNRPEADSQAKATPSSESTEEERPAAEAADILHSPCKRMSSNESEDDEFFDACSPTRSPFVQRKVTGSNAAHLHESVSVPWAKGTALLVYDPLSTAEEEDLDGNLESDKSIIMHLLSQVRIGMDLTKIVLPTFILERRSTLEMYADFFAHANLFSNIPNYSTPKERFVEVIRWYVSSLHAGRKGTLAKKPYNPILGETFRCMWNVESSGDVREAPQSVLDSGPVPWAHQDSVTFIAEQVSHHPPVAAFYAEHASKLVSFYGSIWTKSKYLGLSLCANMIGEGVLKDLKHNEEYVMTFPSVYARSILTRPWMEIGGKTTVTCPTNGFSANFEFHCKPMIGGCKDRVTGELFEPSAKKPFMTIDGLWNGTINSKIGKTVEVLVDTKKMPIIPKLVQNIDEQQEFESRKLWRHVTENLASKNIEAATEHKYKLEERQRAGAKERKENNTEWEQKLFTGKVGSGFVYKTPLQTRLGVK